MRCLDCMTSIRGNVFTIAALWLLLWATPCYAEPILWASGYWQEFQEYWEGIFRRQDGVIMTVLIAGAIALFIITRVKGNKS
jgi:hypothetical protein